VLILLAFFLLRFLASNIFSAGFRARVCARQGILRVCGCLYFDGDLPDFTAYR